MKLTRSVSEKRTSRTYGTDQFLGQEFYASRTIELPDDTSPDQVFARSLALDLELRREVLTSHVLAGTLTMDGMNEALASAEALVQQASAQTTEFPA